MHDNTTFTPSDRNGNVEYSKSTRNIPHTHKKKIEFDIEDLNKNNKQNHRIINFKVGFICSVIENPKVINQIFMLFV